MRGVRAEGAAGDEPKKSSKETEPDPEPAAGTAGGVSEPSSPKTELNDSVSAAGRVGAPALPPGCGCRTAGAGAWIGGRAERMPWNSWATECPPVSPAA